MKFILRVHQNMIQEYLKKNLRFNLSKKSKNRRSKPQSHLVLTIQLG